MTTAILDNYQKLDSCLRRNEEVLCGDYNYRRQNKKVATFADNEYIYHHEDHLTGTSIDTDESGSVNQLNDYYPYGDERLDEKVGSYENDYGYTGKELDDETGLHYYEARYYDAHLARFTSVDTWAGELTDPQSLNKYAYVRNNPLKYVDPDGKNPLAIMAAAGAVLAGITPGDILDAVPGTGDLNDMHIAAGGEKYLFSGTKATQEDRDAVGAMAILPGGAGSLKIGKKVKKFVNKILNSTDNAFKHAYKYLPRIEKRAQQYKFHDFPYSFDDKILQGDKIKQKDGSLLYTEKGSFNGKSGQFELGINEEKGTIFHRMFKQDKNSVAGSSGNSNVKNNIDKPDKE